jgi:hypothetical protein
VAMIASLLFSISALRNSAELGKQPGLPRCRFTKVDRLRPPIKESGLPRRGAHHEIQCLFATSEGMLRSTSFVVYGMNDFVLGEEADSRDDAAF